MDVNFPSYILGPLFLIFILAFVVVTIVGVKTVLRACKERVFSSKKLEEPPKPPVPPKTVKTKKPRQIRSIEINPDDVDRIYVKKSS